MPHSLDADGHDTAFVLSDGVVGGADDVDHFLEMAIAQLEGREDTAQVFQGLLRYLAGAAMRCDGLHGDGELVPQQFKAPAGFLRIGAAIALGLFLVRIGGFFRPARRRWRTRGRTCCRQLRFLAFRVQEAGDQVADAAFAFDDVVVVVDHGRDCAREVGHGGHDVADAFPRCVWR